MASTARMEFPNIIGNRFYNRDIDESFTVIGIEEINGEPMMAVLQYDDGTFWDESIVDEPTGDRFGWSTHGLLGEQYEHRGPGPTITHACDKRAHSWFPRPGDLWDDLESVATDKRDLYSKFARCVRCGLSLETCWDYGLEDLDVIPMEWQEHP